MKKTKKADLIKMLVARKRVYSTIKMRLIDKCFEVEGLKSRIEIMETRNPKFNDNKEIRLVECFFCGKTAEYKKVKMKKKGDFWRIINGLVMLSKEYSEIGYDFICFDCLREEIEIAKRQIKTLGGK